MRKSTAIVALAYCCVLWFSPAAPAATITWGAPIGITGDSDVSTAGTTINAVNLGTSGFADTTTVNTITFNGASPSGGTLVSGDFSFASFVGNGRFSTTSAPYANLASEYQDLLRSGLETGSGSYTLTMSSLTAGSNYQFQFWCDNSTTNSGQITATAGNAVTLSSNPSGISGGLGQFAIGTFTADSSSEMIIFASSDQYAYLNGAQLSLLSPVVPEPGATALFGLALAGVCALSRRRDHVGHMHDID